MLEENSQNGLRMYPELLPHQLRPISTYPNPPISHIEKIKNCVFFVIFRYFPWPGQYMSFVRSKMEEQRAFLIGLFGPGFLDAY